MILTENLMNNFSFVLNEDHLNLKEKTSAKVITHKDTDGLISGITMVHALVKQGIPRERITVKFAQYGDDDKSYEKFLAKNKQEYVAVTDFAKFPKVKIYDVYQILFNWKKKPRDFIAFVNSKDFSKISYDEFVKLLGVEVKEKDKLQAGNLKALYYGLVAYYKMDKETRPALDVSTEQLRKIKIVTNRPNLVSDHHGNENGSLSGGDDGEIAIKSPSEASFAANKYLPGAWSKEDLEAVDMIDSAGYTQDQLRNSMFLEKNFSGADRKKSLAAVITALGTQIIKKNPELAAKIVRESNTSLVSVYLNIVNALKIDKKEKELYDSLKSGDIKKAKQIADEIGDKRLTKNWAGNPDKFKSTGGLNTLESFREKNKKDIQKHIKSQYINDVEYNERKTTKDSARKEELNKKTSDLFSFNNFTIQNIRTLVGYPDRFINSLFSEKGYMNPYAIKKFPMFVQVACNPLYKGNVDFSAVSKKVLPEIKQKLLDSGIIDLKTATKIMDGMLEENGGHKSIYSFQGFKAIKAPYNISGEYYKNKDFVDRVSGLQNASKDKKKLIAAKAKERIKQLQPEMDKYDKLKKEVIDYTASRIVYWTNKMYPVDEEKRQALKSKDKTFERE